MLTKSIQLRCDDECCTLFVDKYEDAYNISMQDSRVITDGSLRQRLKTAFNVLFSKPVYYNDLYIQDPQRVKIFAEKILEMVDGDE